MTAPATPNPTTCSTISASVKASGNPYQFQCGTLTAIPALKPIAATNNTLAAKPPNEPSTCQTNIAAINALTQLVANSVSSCPPVNISPGGGLNNNSP